MIHHWVLPSCAVYTMTRRSDAAKIHCAGYELFEHPLYTLYSQEKNTHIVQVIMERTKFHFECKFYTVEDLKCQFIFSLDLKKNATSVGGLQGDRRTALPRTVA